MMPLLCDHSAEFYAVNHHVLIACLSLWFCIHQLWLCSKLVQVVCFLILEFQIL